VEQYKEEAAQNYLTHPLIVELKKKYLEIFLISI